MTNFEAGNFKINITPEYIFKRTWVARPNDWIAPTDRLASKELFLWTAGDKDVAKRTLCCIELLTGHIFVLVEKPDGEVTQVWQVM